MKIAVIDDYQDAFRRTKGFQKLAGHEVTVYTDTEKDPEKLAARLKDADGVVLTQQRSRFPRTVIERLPRLKFISQTGRNAGHIDLAACAERGIVVSGRHDNYVAPDGVPLWNSGGVDQATHEVGIELLHMPRPAERQAARDWYYRYRREAA